MKHHTRQRLIGIYSTSCCILQ